MGYQFDINGRTTGMTSDTGSGPQTFATATYTPIGQLYKLSYGGLTETDTYNNMMQLVSQTVPGYLNMTYNYSPTQNNGRITSSVDGITGENTSYTYDALNRLTGASNASWNGTYQYDGFGNLTSKSGTGGSPNAFPSMTATYNVHNQLTTGSYDANGNTIVASGYTVGYSVENKMISQTAPSWPWGVTLYDYDPSGRRVMKETNPDPNNYEGQNNPTWEFYFYTIGGQRLVTIDCNNANAQYLPNCWVTGENVYFKSKLLVSNGAYVVTDRLGSVRANTQGESFAYYPYGEERTNTVNMRDKFGTYFRDAVGQDYAEQRYYNAGIGRFWSVDPTIDNLDYLNSGSWNMYTYANGEPVNSQDPDGLSTCADALFSYNGQVIGTVSQALNLTNDVTVLAETEYTEAGHGSGANSTAEEDMIGEVIMNRWALVNGYSYLYPNKGRPPLDVSAWGTPGGGLASIAQAPGQFAVWQGSSLTASAQRNLNAALDSNFDSRLCDDLAWAIGSAISFVSSPQVEIYYDPSTNLAPLAFNSGNLFVPRYMRRIGSFGDANVFYGAPVVDFSANLLPLPRPSPPRLPKRPRPPRNPFMVQ
jgi:RHS repeat-associated protein